MDGPFTSMTETQFRVRFKTAFDLEPNLTPEQFFVILSASKFNSHDAYQKVADGVRNPAQFLIPHALSRGSQIPFNVLSPKAGTSKQSLEQKLPVEDSADEVFTSIEEDTIFRKRLALQPKASRPSRHTLSSAEEYDGEELLEDCFRPPKRRFVSSYSVIKTSRATTRRTKTIQHKTSIASRKKSSIREPFSTTRRSSPSLNDFDYDSELPLTSELVRAGYTAHRTVKENQKPKGIPDYVSFIKLSDLGEAGSEADADAEFDSGSESGQSPISWDSSNEIKTSKSKPTRNYRGGTKKNMDEEVLKHRLETKATPHIRRVAGALFNRAIGAAEGDFVDIEEKVGLIDLTCDPKVIRRAAWEGTHETEHVEFVKPSTWHDSTTGRTGYSAVVIDGVTYRPGDCVIIRPPGSIPTLKREAKRGKREASPVYDEVEPWFARIAFLFEDEDGSECVHFRQFDHGADTIFGSETAGPRELFLTTACEDDTLFCIAAKIKVDFVSGKVDGDDGNGVVEHNFKDKNHYFYRFHWRSDQERFTDAAGHENLPRKSGPQCDCCEEKEKTREFAMTRVTLESSGDVQGFSQGGVNYRLYDFVYITPPESTDPYDIGQITEIGYFSSRQYVSSSKEMGVKVELAIQVRLLHRHDLSNRTLLDEIEAGQKHTVRDERRLYFTNKVSCISSKQIQGKCQVLHPSDIDDLDVYKDDLDTFWVQDKVSKSQRKGKIELQPLHLHEMQISEETKIEISTRNSLKKRFLSEFQPLLALELFFGCGGMSLGLEQSGCIKPKWAVEFAPSAAGTGRRNFPDVIFYNEDGSVCLERAMKEAAGIDLDPQEDNSGNPILRMPRTGEVEVIVAGFPCPGYSRANHSPKADDIKNTLITMTLSYVEFYRPKYVLLENVKELLSHRLGGRQAGPNKVEGGLERGTVKFILRSLTSMGYQVQFTVLQAGEYCLPQSRQRVFFWASLPGNELPNYPRPRTKFSGICATSWHRRHDYSGGAPLPQVTIGDTLTDLPAFDWVNPHLVAGQSDEENLDRLQRATKIRQVKVRKHKNFVGYDKQSYACRPLSEYQRRLRKGVPHNTVLNHVTIKYYDEPRWNKRGGLENAKTEQVCSIPMRPGADHRDLPEKLKPWCLSHPDSRASKYKFYPGRYGRLDMEKHFETCLTEIDPNGKNGTTVHPTQHRVVSIREYARAMGFPDSFTFDLKNIRIALVIRMIGNAVPVPLAKALGDELLETLFEQWLRDGKAIKEKCSVNKVKEAIVSSDRDVEDQKVETTSSSKKEGTVNNPINLDDDDDEDDGGG